MIIRTIEGDLIKIDKYSFKNDKLYFNKIMSLKEPFTKLKKTFNYKNK